MNATFDLAEARCLGCSYSLHGLEVPCCPECGREFDPADPRTVYTGLPVGAIGRALLSPVGRRTDALAYTAAGALLWGEGWLPGGIYVTLAGFVLCAMYFGYRALRAILRFVVAKSRRRPCETRRQWRPLLVLGVAVLVCMFAIPEYLVTWIHEPLLQRYVRHIHADIPLMEAEKEGGQRMVGLMCIHDVHLSPSSVRLVIGPRGMLAYSEHADKYSRELVNPQVNDLRDLFWPSRWRRGWW